MDRSVVRMVVLSVFAVLCFQNWVGAANDMTLSISNGDELILHSDSTWEYKDKEKSLSSKLTESEIIGLTNGKNIKISPDNTWKFVSNKEAQAKESTIIQEVKARGVGKSMDNTEAQASANRQARINALKNLKSSLGKRLLNPQQLDDCLNKVELNIQTKEAFSKGVGYTITVELSFDKTLILSLLECANAQK